MKSVFMAFFILLVHVLLLVGIGLLVLFFRGVIQYMAWIFLIGAGCIIASAWYFLKRMKEEGKSLKEMLALPEFSGTSVEVNILGGLASVRINRDAEAGISQIDGPGGSSVIQLEDPATLRIRNLTELARLRERDVITEEEFQRAKSDLLGSGGHAR